MCAYCVLISHSCMCPTVCCSRLIFFFKQKTAYEVRISDWSSDVCSSDLLEQGENLRLHRDIQCRNGLVGDEDFRIERQGPGDADALALAAGKFMRIALDGAGVEEIGRAHV